MYWPEIGCLITILVCCYFSGCDKWTLLRLEVNNICQSATNGIILKSADILTGNNHTMSQIQTKFESVFFFGLTLDRNMINQSWFGEQEWIQKLCEGR